MKKETFLGRPVKHHSPARDYPRSTSSEYPIWKHRPKNLTPEEQKLLDQKRWEMERERRLLEKLEQGRKYREILERHKLGIQGT